MGCSAYGGTTEELCYPIDGDVPCGVLAGHAYSIIDVFELNVKVLKVVNENEREDEIP